MSGNGWVRTELSKISESSKNSDKNEAGTHNTCGLLFGGERNGEAR